MRDKPTLDELFESKKLDLPDDDFWNGFQNRVKGQAIAALSQRSRTSKLRRVALFGFVPVFALVMISWGILQPHITSEDQEKLLAVNVAIDQKQAAFDELASVLVDDLSIECEGAYQIAKLESFDSFANSRIELARGRDSFNQHILSTASVSGTSSNYTF